MSSVQEANKQLLKQAPAGIRLIAQLTIFNSGNFGRLKQYVEENYHPTLLEEQSAAARMALLKAEFRLSGKVRIRQVIVAEKYEVVVLVDFEKSDRVFVVALAIEEDYPHRVTVFNQG